MKRLCIKFLYIFPAQKITINLAPAELPKDGTHFDIPIALSILVASGQLKQTEVNDALFAGELALNGALRPIRGAVLLAELARAQGLKRLFIPRQNVAQASLVSGIEIIGVATLQELFQGLKGVKAFSRHPAAPLPLPVNLELPTIDTVVGHEHGKRALIIAVAGRHNLLLSGSPGAGKSLLAKSLKSILPPLTEEEVLEVTKLHSLATGDDGTVYRTPPFRSPHHSATMAAFIGGGLRPRPGDISLAHKGVLFLDELPEYPRATLEALRQPLEDRSITLSRLYGTITYPADVLLAATMNPCPCGYLGDSRVACVCSGAQISAYKHRISGPLLDRIDIRLTISKISNEHFFGANTLQEKQHLKVLKLINAARLVQEKRYKRSGHYNAYALISDVHTLFNMTPAAKQLIKSAAEKLNLSSRSALRVTRVARTIADLEASEALDDIHVAEALQFR
jgi:magnesium chelatase family protein